jgi:signal transduction histidine kinase/CheY-like chemotaxis protein
MHKTSPESTARVSEGRIDILDLTSRYVPIRPVLLRRISVALLFVSAALGLRYWPLGALGTIAPWLTFYPFVMVIAILEGFFGGVIGAILSCLFVLYVWPVVIGTIPITRGADVLGMGVFFLNLLLVSAVAESMRRARERARQAQEKAEQANKAKTIFLANMSHELRTPLNAVLGFSHILRMAPDVTPKQKTILQIVSQSGEHLLRLINNILELSRIESGTITLDEQPTDIHRVVRDVKEMLDPRAAEKRLRIAMEIGPNVPRFVQADVGKLTQILINLVSNAVKFTSDGSITVRVSSDDFVSPQQPTVRFEVEDTGRGIDPKDRERIFAPFVQAENQGVGESGIGLGLAICRQYVELMNGRISVTSAPSGGALFVFEISLLPLNLAALPASDEFSWPTLAPGQAQRKLLIVEDQMENRMLLRDFLEPLGVDLREAENGREAVDISESWRPDLIFMDIRMPVMDGIEATKSIRSSNLGSTVKIIALTAHVLGEEREAILSSGCDQLIHKPFALKDILGALEMHLNMRFERKQGMLEAKTDVATGILIDDIRVLPREILAALTTAFERLDANQSRSILQRIEDENVRARLTRMVEQLRFKELLEATDHVYGNP